MFWLYVRWHSFYTFLYLSALALPGSILPETFPRYLPPAGSQTPVAGKNFDDSMAPSYPSSAEVHIMRYKIPEAKL